LQKLLEAAEIPNDKRSSIRLVITTCYSNKIAENFSKNLPEELKGVSVSGVGHGKSHRRPAGGDSVSTRLKHDETEKYLLTEHGIIVEAAVQRKKAD